MKEFYVYFKPSWSKPNGHVKVVSAASKREVILKFTLAEDIVEVNG